MAAPDPARPLPLPPALPQETSGRRVLYARSAPMPVAAPSETRSTLLFQTPEELLRDLLSHNPVVSVLGLHENSLQAHTVSKPGRHLLHYIDVHVGKVRLQVSKPRFKRYRDTWRLLASTAFTAAHPYRSSVLRAPSATPEPAAGTRTTPPLTLSPRGRITRVYAPSPLGTREDDDASTTTPTPDRDDDDEEDDEDFRLDPLLPQLLGDNNDVFMAQAGAAAETVYG
jgi:hypothetical protein